MTSPWVSAFVIVVCVVISRSQMRSSQNDPNDVIIHRGLSLNGSVGQKVSEEIGLNDNNIKGSKMKRDRRRRRRRRIEREEDADEGGVESVKSDEDDGEPEREAGSQRSPSC